MVYSDCENKFKNFYIKKILLWPWPNSNNSGFWWISVFLLIPLPREVIMFGTCLKNNFLLFVAYFYQIICLNVPLLWLEIWILRFISLHTLMCWDGLRIKVFWNSHFFNACDIWLGSLSRDHISMKI